MLGLKSKKKQVSERKKTEQADKVMDNNWIETITWKKYNIYIMIKFINYFADFVIEF